MEQEIIDLKAEQPFKRFTDKIGFGSLLKNLPRTLLALTSTLVFSIFMTAMQAVTDNRAITAGLHRQAEDPLPDLLMDLAPMGVPMHMADLLLNSLIFFTVLVFLLSWKWRCQAYGLDEGHYRTLRLARKFLWMLSLAYIFRSLSLLTTTMPPTDPRCVYKQRNWRQIPFMAFEIMTKKGNTCSDKIFSGHSSMATLICLFWLGALLRPERSSHDSRSQNVSLWRYFAAFAIVAWTFAVYVFCVLCRNHYTIDIVVAIIVCTGIFSTFQLSLKIIELLQSSALSNSTSATDFAWNQHQSGYSPLKNDHETTGPQFTMIQIDHQDFKPGRADEKKSSPKIAYVPRSFILFLKAIAWMDGIDLKP